MTPTRSLFFVILLFLFLLIVPVSAVPDWTEVENESIQSGHVFEQFQWEQSAGGAIAQGLNSINVFDVKSARTMTAVKMYGEKLSVGMVNTTLNWSEQEIEILNPDGTIATTGTYLYTRSSKTGEWYIAVFLNTASYGWHIGKRLLYPGR